MKGHWSQDSFFFFKYSVTRNISFVAKSQPFLENKKTVNTSMFIIKYKNNPKICVNLHFDIIKLNNKRHMVPLPKNAANFGLVDK